MKTDECVTSIIKQLTDDIRKKIRKGEDLLKRRYKIIDSMRDEAVTHKEYIHLEKEREILNEEIVRTEYELDMLQQARETCFTAATLYNIEIGEI